MTVIRRKVSRNYTVITNNCFEDVSLTGELLGLLTYLLSRPHNWHVRPQHLAKRMGWGRDKTYNALNALTNQAYIERRQLRDAIDGKFKAYEYIVYDDRVAGLSDERAPRTEMPLTENQKAVKRISNKNHKILPSKSPIEKLIDERSGSPQNNRRSYQKDGEPPLRKPQSHRTARPWAERGKFEAELALRLGKDGWEILSTLPDWQVMQLCRAQSHGNITAEQIEELKFGHLQKRSLSTEKTPPDELQRSHVRSNEH